MHGRLVLSQLNQNKQRITKSTSNIKTLYSSKHYYSNASTTIETDSIFELSSSSIRYGPGSTSEVGQDLSFLKAKKVIVFTDKNISTLPCMEHVIHSLDKEKTIHYDVYSKVRVEPNDKSFQEAIDFMCDNGPYDAVVALGGGSVIDTAKVANLYTSHPPKGDFYDYVNPPLGRGLPPPGPILPLIAIPTTAGTGSETTGIAIFDDSKTKSKTGIGHRFIRPTLGIVDPDNLLTIPAEVAKYTGLDVLCHAIESYTALPFNQRPKPTSPLLRPAYQGSNPLSDIWSLNAMQNVLQNLKPFLSDPEDPTPRYNMLLASTMAGIGFGNAGVHLCHGMSYPIASRVRSYKPMGYPDTTHPLIPHGLSVIVAAPSVFQYTGSSCPDRHWKCASLLASHNRNVQLPNTFSTKEDVGNVLANEILEFMSSLNVPTGLRSLGYSKDDVDSLAKGTIVQQRVVSVCPKQPVTLEDVRELFRKAL